MGEVYRARDSRLAREVAIKVLPASYSRDEERLRRFEREARTTGALNHPNIVAVYDVGEHDGSPYLVTELLEGKTLRTLMHIGAVARRKVLEWALQIAQGLWAAHLRGIVHRDLKPENLFVTTSGQVKILDFGLAKLTQSVGDESATLSMQTEPGTVIGTAGYMSPEQVRGETIDPRSDIFSFGVILYEMLAGSRPFRHDTPVETMNAILNEDPPPLADLALDRVVRHALEKNPGERFQSVRDLAFDLEALSGASSKSAAQQPEAPRRRRALTALLALSIAAAIAGGYFLARTTLPAPAALPTFHQLTFRLGNVSQGRFAPDGRNVVYSAAWDGKPIELFTTSTDGPESRPLGWPTGGLLAVSRSGEVALTQGCEFNWGACQGTLARVPLAGGAPREVLANVQFAEWSPDGKLAVVRAAEGRNRLEYPIGKVLYQTTGWITHPRFSPKGDRIAFADHPKLGDAGGTVAVVDLTGKKRTLSREARSIQGLAWWPSGEEVWYSGSGSLSAVTLSGRERVVLRSPTPILVNDISRDGRILLIRQNARAHLVFSSGRGQTRDLSWFNWSTAADISADGRILLFHEWSPLTGSAPAVYLRKSDGSVAVRVGEGKALALSPDGKYALSLQGTSPPQMVLLPTGVGEQRTLPSGGMTDYYSATWFPDARRILFVAEGKDHVPRSYIQRIDGGEPQPVAIEGLMAVLVSPDGKRMAAYGPDREVYNCPVGEGTPEAIAGVAAGETLIQWSADGRSLFVRAPGDSAVRIFRVDLATGRRQLWREFTPDPVGNIGLENAVRITPDGTFCLFTYWTAINEIYMIEGLK
jgi:Tol biopolymer transport system component